MKYEALKTLLPYIEAYESGRDKGEKTNPVEFANWILKQPSIENELEISHEKTKSEDSFQSPSMSPQGHTQAQIAQLLNLMYKYLKFYIRKGLESTKISNPDDFGFLATLLLEGKLHKHRLIEKNTMEFSSGMEVIKRLERNHLIKSETDPQDKRAKLVCMTEKGRAVIFRAMPIMQQIGSIAIAKLSISEQETLLSLLNKLNDFHNPIFFEAKKSSIEEIRDTYL